MKNLSNLIFINLIIILFVGCLRYQPKVVNYLTIYNLDEVSSMEITIDSSFAYYSKINTELEDGTKIKGDILLNERPTPRGQAINHPTIPYNQILTASDRIAKIDSTYLKTKNNEGKSLPELFGFSKNSNVSPKGSATILVGSEKSIQIVFYQIDYGNQFGSGIGYDNLGKLYRVYLNTEAY